MYPVMLQVRGRRCLVVGGGGVALRKVQGLLDQDARVMVVSPEPLEPLIQLSSQGKIHLETRPYRQGEAYDYALVFAATDDREVNRAVFEDAESSGVWVNVADDPELCSFHLPAQIKRGSLQLAVASAGEAPFVVRRMRKLLEQKLGPEWSEWTDSAARFRKAVRNLKLTKAEQERIYDTFFTGTVDAGKLRARVPSSEEESNWLSGDRGGDGAKACRTEFQEITRQEGFVSLVGAGPGDAGLLTLRGRQRLLCADAVVYDNLALPALPCDLPARVELHCVGKQAGHHPVPQEEINAMLLRLAREGKRVVRLKGGDPFVFGRGGEEAEVLAAAGISFEVVPAVTAGVAAPAYAGIPITHRQEVVRVTFVTAHESDKDQGPQVRWDLLGQDPHATLIGYMGVTSLPQVVDRLLGAGMHPDTPAAMLERGTTPLQRTVCSTVSKLPTEAKKAGLRPPGLFVIGPSVRHAEQLNWFGSKPLFGQRLLMVAPMGELGEALEMSGAQVVEVPLPLGQAARAVIGAIPLTGCVFRSTSEVEALEEERDAPGWGPQVMAFCLSPKASKKARELGWIRVKELQQPTTPIQFIDAK